MDNFSFIVIGTDENDTVWAYRMASLDDAHLFVRVMNARDDIDIHFQVIALMGEMTAAQAIDDLLDLKGIEDEPSTAGTA
jgi:hypothetical protein